MTYTAQSNQDIVDAIQTWLTQEAQKLDDSNKRTRGQEAFLLGRKNAFAEVVGFLKDLYMGPDQIKFTDIETIRFKVVTPGPQERTGNKPGDHRYTTEQIAHMRDLHRYFIDEAARFMPKKFTTEDGPRYHQSGAIEACKCIAQAGAIKQELIRIGHWVEYLDLSQLRAVQRWYD